MTAELLRDLLAEFLDKNPEYGEAQVHIKDATYPDADVDIYGKTMTDTRHGASTMAVYIEDFYK